MEAAGVEFVSLNEAEGAQFRALTEEKLWDKVTSIAPDDAARLKPLFDSASS